jgi:hypothetical protein
MVLDLAAARADVRALSSRRAGIVRAHAEDLQSHRSARVGTDQLTALSEIIRDATYEAREAIQLGNLVVIRLKSGFGVTNAKLLVSDIRGYVADAAVGLEALVKSVCGSDLPEELEESAAQFTATVRGVKATLTVLDESASMLHRERQPIDEERLRKGLEQATTEQGMSAAEVIAALRARRA